MNKKKIIGYVSAQNPYTDRKSWSGTNYKLREAIENSGYEVRWIPYRVGTKKEFLLRCYYKLYSLICCGGKVYLTGSHCKPIAKLYAKSIHKNKAFNECDYLFFPAGAQIAPFMDTDKPVIFHGDATFQKVKDYYFYNVCEKSLAMALQLDKNAAQNAWMNIRSSQWAADSVVNDYKANPDMSFVLEFGANIDMKDIAPCIPYSGGVLNVMFSGVEWERKGGDIAVKAVEALNSHGIEAHLYIAGIKELPEYCRSLQYVTNAGFLNKNIPEQYDKYVELWQKCHIFLLPTKAECAGIVFCEAAAYGMPVYTHDTGGIGNYVINDVNGHRLPLGSTGEDFARCIEADLKKDVMQELRKGALKMSEKRLSWNSWSKRFREIMETHQDHD